jgi:hypothetical protein
MSECLTKKAPMFSTKEGWRVDDSSNGGSAKSIRLQGISAHKERTGPAVSLPSGRIFTLVAPNIPLQSSLLAKRTLKRRGLLWIIEN